MSVILPLNAPPPVKPVPAVTVLVVLTTVESTAISSALASIPSPPATLSVTSPVNVPPPVKPVPAITDLERLVAVPLKLATVNVFVLGLYVNPVLSTSIP